MNRVLTCLGVVVVLVTVAFCRSSVAEEKKPRVTAADSAARSSAVSMQTQAASKEKAKGAPKEKPKPADKKGKSDAKAKTTEKPQATGEGKAAEQAKTVEPPKTEAKAGPQAKPEAKPDQATAVATPDAEKKAEPKKPEKPATYTVSREPLKVELSLKGVFEAVEMVPVAIRPKQWKDLTVVEAVEHGREVHKGDVLVRLDLEKVDEQIADMRRDLELADLTMKQAEETLRILQESTPLDLEMAERSKRHADEDLDRFFKVDRPMYRKVSEFMLKMSEQSLEYQKEELDQLEKMYKADDLTEQTEEIVLKRQRNAVEQAKFYLEMAKIRNEESVQINLPRMEEAEKYSTRQQDLAYQKAKITLPVALKQQQLDLAKKKVDRQRAQKRFEELEADRAAMTIKAPADGIVYYGQYTRGQWMGATSVAEELRPKGTLGRDKVFMTIVRKRPMRIRADVPEESLHYVRAGLKGTAEPVGYPDLKLKVSVEKVDALPLGTQYAAVIEPVLPHEADVLVPGMNCTLKFVPYLKKRALVVPASAVFTDKIDSEKKYVYLYAEGEKPQKQFVTVGKRSGDRLEIVEGLDRGDEILLEEPKDQKDSRSKDAQQAKP